MKRLILAAICLSTFALSSFAQTPETFDISTFRLPKGWTKRVGQDAIQFSIADKNEFCLITLYKSLPGLGTPKQNFDAAWNTLAKETITVSTAPQMMPVDSKGEWQIVGGFAPFEKDGEKLVAMLYTLPGTAGWSTPSC